MKYAGVAAWAGVTVTFLAVLVALFKEELQRIWRKPELKALIRSTAPDCHKTEMTFTNPRTFDGQDALTTRWTPCKSGRLTTSRKPAFRIISQTGFDCPNPTSTRTIPSFFNKYGANSMIRW